MIPRGDGVGPCQLEVLGTDLARPPDRPPEPGALRGGARDQGHPVGAASAAGGRGAGPGRAGEGEDGVHALSPSQLAGMNSLEVKAVLVGAYSVGKTSLATQYVNGTFNPFTDATIGAAFLTKIVNLDDMTVKFQIWDTAGGEKYKSVVPMYYRNSQVAIIVFSIVDRYSFDRARELVEEVRTYSAEGSGNDTTDPVIAIVGNKLDLQEDRVVSTSDASEFADSVGAIYVEASAKTGEGISELFDKIIVSLPRKQLAETAANKKKDDDMVRLEESEEKQGKKKNCC